jgi:hypothetical protein
MTPARALGGFVSLGRAVLGVAFIVQPKLVDGAWVGKTARLPGSQVLTRAVGARDLTVGAGGLQAVARGDGSARPWLLAAACCDVVDFGATWAAGRGIPAEARRGVLVVAGAFGVLSAVTAVGNGRPVTASSPDRN